MEVNEQIEVFKEFIELHYKAQLYDIVKSDKKSLIISFQDLVNFNHELADNLLDEPEETIKSAELSLEHFDIPEENKKGINVRFKDLPETQKSRISDVRSIHLGQFLFIEGIVRQASDVRPQVTNAKFECAGCGNTLSIIQIDQKFKEPSRCTCGWRGKFRLLSKELIDVQHLKIEESPESLYGGEQPKRLSVFLKEDLVEPKMERKTTPGAKVRIYGVVKEVPIQLKTGAQSTRYDLVLEANNIEPVQEDYSDITLTKEDENTILTFSKDAKVFEKFSKSIAPSIYGHDRIKDALVLQLFGGVRKEKPDGTTGRGDVHVLLVGDPGAGKSQLLQFIFKAAPKARFVSGKGVSGAGLTASVVKDEFLKGWSLEAGALPLANKGIAIVDELDKIDKEDTAALHSAMEQQIIPISKANVQATLTAQTTLLAAANPKLGRFDPYTPIASQIDLPSTLINRFDLIFTVRDIPSRERDERIALHVLESSHGGEIYNTEVSVDFLRKYIAYAKQKITPKLTKEAINEIKDFYVQLRNSGKADDEGIKPIPISARQLEGLIRLSEASAKIRLDNNVSREDARRAIELLRHCLMQVGFDPETGQIDIDRISSGITASTRSKIIAVKEIIIDLEGKGMKEISIEEIIAQAAAKGIEDTKVEEAIEQLKKSGDIFEPKRNFISRVS
ncbi:minichromosome maintenance protein MCM [Candidatus Woesearchaeota archaeon]|nr:minichromosome maintenance protein MCM [Candidatus Woesearchaeota archaeon]